MFFLERLLGGFLFGLMSFFELTPEWLDSQRQRREAAADDYRARWEARRRGLSRNDLDISKHDRYVEISFKGRR